jgi:hypothetical protein
MLQLQPDKTITIEQIRDEIAAQLQKLDDYNVRVVSGFVNKLVEHFERTNETQGAS